MSSVATVSLFEKLGGLPAIKAVVEEFNRRLLEDNSLKGFFKNTDMDRQIQSQIEFLTFTLGGPNNYKGRPIKKAHEGLGITEFHFDRLAEHLVETLNWAGVGDLEINAVLELIGPLKSEVVEE